MQRLLDLIRNLIDYATYGHDLLIHASWWPLATWAVTVLLGMVATGRLWVATKDYFLKKRSDKAARLQDENLRLHWFQGQDFVSALKDYLVPYCSNVDPSDREDLRNTVAVREPVFDALERELIAEDKRHILVLADSGMGKTTLLLNLVAREQHHRRLALVPLGEADAMERLEAIPNKRETVLLLDAFDEDPRAIEDAAIRMETIMTAAAPFKCVVMTCRTQFFPSDEQIPRQTGIKRVSARRAGVPVVYQWLTVYLQPFDRRQIDQYIRMAIPWRRFEQRNKAKRIVADISDLAARPMLTALIPSLAASRREAHSLWDLYAFMVDTWIQRESSWISPEVLIQMSKAVAVELVDKRGSRGMDRMSREDLIKLRGTANTSVETWQLTSRSLLNRDSDGYYKFAHRSILEFFFIKAFIEGEPRCLSIKWTDMMCDLFLSWGSSTCCDFEQSERLISADFRATGLFPVVERHHPSARLDTNWVKNVFSATASISARAKLPKYWRGVLAHVVERDTMARAYDIADGLVWQLDVTNSIHDREERHVYQHNRYSLAGFDEGEREWAVVDLYELKLLCDILEKRNILYSLIDGRELYWLADTGDGNFSALARINFGHTDDVISYPDLEFVQSGSSGETVAYTIDVYRVATRGVAVNKIRAMTILAHHGDAAAILADDKGNGKASSWGIRRDMKLPANQSFPSRRPFPQEQ